MQLSKFAKKFVTVNSVAVLLSAAAIPIVQPPCQTVHAASTDDSGVSEWKTWGTVKWGIDENGTLWIKPQKGSNGSIGDVYGEIAGDTIRKSTIPWFTKAANIKSVRLEGTITGSSFGYLFAGLTNCIDIDLTNLKTDYATNMQAMFAEDMNLERITGLNKFNTSKVTDMYGVFQNCPKLTDDTVSGVAKWDTSKVTDMGFMFYNCKSLTVIPVNGWNTSSVTSFFGIFDNCSNLATLDVSKWNTDNATDMSWMFNGCMALKTIDVSNWNTSKVTTMSTMFNGCSSLTNLDVSKWDTTNIITTAMMFNGCSSLTNLDVSKWNTSKITAMNNMFSGCANLINLDVSKWDTSRVTNMYALFSSCASLINLDVSKWDTAGVTNMYSLFSGCSSLVNLDVSKWDTSKTITMYALFSNCPNIVKLDLSSWSTKSITNTDSSNTNYIFSGDNKLSELKLCKDFILKGGEDSLPDPAKTGEYTGRWSKADGSNGMSAKEMLSLTGKEHTASSKSLNKTLDAVDRAGAWIWERGYTVTVDPNGGTGTAKSYVGALSEDQTYGRGSVDVYIEDPGYTRKAYESTGANEKKDGTGTKHQYPFTLQTSSNKTIYAQWKFNGLKISYHANGGKGTMSDTAIAKGDTTTLTSNSFTRAGFTFNGWNTKSDGKGTSYSNAQSVAPDYNLDLYAQWKGIPYTIKFDANTGTGSMSDESLVYGTAKAISKNTFTKKSYAFAGWNTKPDGKGTEYADRQEVSDLSASGQTITLYAQWRKADWNSSGDDITKTKDEGDSDATHDAGTYILTIPTKIMKKGMPVGNINESISYGVNVTGNIPEGSYVHVSAAASSLTGNSGSLDLGVAQGKKTWNENDAYGTVNPDGSLSGSTASDTVTITGTAKSTDQYTGLVTYSAVMNKTNKDPISSKTSWGSFSISSQDKKAIETYEDSGQLGFTAGTTLHSDLTGVSYQWSINGKAIAGATQADYLVKDADLRNGEENGKFQSNKLECTVTKADGTKETSYVYLAVPLTYTSEVNIDLRRTLTDNGHIAYEGYTTPDGTATTNTSSNCGWRVPKGAVSFKATDEFVPSGMFMFAYGVRSLETFDGTNIDTSQVTSMQDLFYLCNKIQTLDVSGWDVSNVKYFILAFGSMSNLTTLKGIESWDTQSATDMQSMFYQDGKLSADLSSWNVSKVTVSSTFNYGASKVIPPKF